MGSVSELRLLGRSVVKPTKAGSSSSREVEKLLLTGFDFRSLKQSIFHKRLLLFKQEQEGFDYEHCSKKLKETLAITLEKCYPFAGRLVQEQDGTLVFLCNDAGVEFIDAAAAAPLTISELLGNNRFEFEESLCPDIPFDLELLAKGAAVPIVAAQMTSFDEGGFAIGVTFHHGASDGTSVFQFLKVWAEVSRGDEVSAPLDFTSRAELLNLTPHNNSPPQVSATPKIPNMFTTAPLFGGTATDKQPQPAAMAMKILFISLDVEAVNKLKLKVQEDQKGGGAAAAPFSSYVTITALLWRASVRARQLREQEETRCFNAMNCRSRCQRLPENHFGNAAFTAIAAAPAGWLLGNGISYAASLIAKSIKGVTSEYLQSMSNLMERAKLEKFVLLADFRPPHDVLVVGSSHNPSAECDFGWGQPLALKSMFMEAPLAALIWCPRHRVTGTLELIYKATPAVADAMLHDPELTTFAKVEASEIV